jgi:hypothetical protein
MIIRAFRMDDYDNGASLWLAAGLSVRPGDDRLGIQLAREHDQGLFLVAETGGRLAGTVLGTYDGRRGWVNHLALGRLPSSRRR